MGRQFAAMVVVSISADRREACLPVDARHTRPYDTRAVQGRVSLHDDGRWLSARNGMPAGVTAGERLDHEGAKMAKDAKHGAHEESRRGASLRDLRAPWSS